MPLYKLLYLPTKDQIFTDGCTVLYINGDIKKWEEHHDQKGGLKVAEPVLVKYEFCQMIVVGKPSDGALKFLKAGDEVKAVDCTITHLREDGFYEVSVRCPVCQVLH